MEWEPVIGIEVHTQLKTVSKIFSGAATHYGADPNTQACPIDLGMPGTLPVINKKAVELAIKFGLSIGGTITLESVFARKHYFYPDLPKGYQISQFDFPIITQGYLDIFLSEGEVKRIGISRAHLEEDAGKSLHDAFNEFTGIDLNRAGTPLLEIVSEPDMRSAAEAVTYLKTLHALVRYIEISDGNLQEGSFRCDVNVSLRPKGQLNLGTRAEIKNINSFRFVEKAIQYEIERQTAVLNSGGKVQQETRLYDPTHHETRAMRSKEEANDYRYFPDPDLLPLVIAPEWIEEIRSTLPELPPQKHQRFQQQYHLNAYDAGVLTAQKELADYFEETLAHTQASAKLTANWIMGELASSLNKENLDITQSPVTSIQLAQLLDRIQDNTISGKIAKTVFEALWQGAQDANTVIIAQGLQQMTDHTQVTTIIDQVIANSPEQLAAYQAGKEKLFGYFVGQVMQRTQGKANPQLVNDLLRQKLQPMG